LEDDKDWLSPIPSTSEKDRPQNKRDAKGKTRIDQHSRAYVGIDPGADKEAVSEQGGNDAYHAAKHPGRE
jgi:hypothetical protein